MQFTYEEYSYDKLYNHSPTSRTTGFSKLMYLIINNVNGNLNSLIIEYINNNLNEINYVNNMGWTLSPEEQVEKETFVSILYCFAYFGQKCIF
jgi:hypothetical protein